MGILGQNRGRDGAMLTVNEHVFTFEDLYGCANVGESRSDRLKSTVRVRTDCQMDRHKPVL